MPDSVEQAGIIVKKIREFVGILKYSPTETVTALVAVLCFSAATLGLSNEFVKPLFGSYVEMVRNGLFAVGVVLIAWTIFRIWKLAIPPELPLQETRPSAIKGPMPFTREDGDFFRGLGREAELKSLLAYVLDEQIPLAIVMGESGVGKTSLLRAGLSQALEQRKIRLIYWEALPTNPMERLLHAIQAYWDAAKDGTKPENISEAINSLSTSTGRTVMVLDQFEQLSPENITHHELFEILKRFATSGLTPYRLTLVVAFRREYDPLWRDFELTIPDFHPPMLSLRLLEKNQARGIMATLAAAANFTLDSELTTDVTDAAADRDGRVSPVDIGIGMLVLSGLTIRKNKKHLSKDDYRFAGGAEGILTAYLSDRLERFPEVERQAVMKALLALCNLDNNQRIAEGKTVDDLSAASQLPPTRLGACLEYLAASHVRLLERMPQGADSSQKYRLPHERLIPSLRRLTGLVLAEADQAELIFENAFRSWLNGRRGQFLLAGADLKKILKNRNQLYGGALRGEKTTFLRLSLQKRFQRRLISGGLLAGLTALTIYSWPEYQKIQAKRDLAEWRLPTDLYEYQSQIFELELLSPLSNLEWLHTKQLQSLNINSPALRAVNGLPPRLIHLVMTNSKLATLAGLEELQQLTTLDLSDNNGLQSLAWLEKLQQLTTLDLSNNHLDSVAGLEKLKHLTTLNLSNTSLKSIAGLEKLQQLTALNLSNTSIESLAWLEKLKQLTMLDLSHTGFQSFAWLELQQLTTLDLSDNHLESVAGLEELQQLTTLKLSGNQLQSVAGLEKLQQLTTLNLSGNQLQSVAGLEKLQQLTTLNLRGNHLRSLPGLEKLQQLTTLDLSDNPVEGFAGLEKLKQLTTLILRDNPFQSFTDLEKLQQLTTLDLNDNNNGLEGLAKLEKLQQLTTLNLRGNHFRRLPGLEKLQRLTTLDLRGNQLQSVAGLEKLQQLTTLNLSDNPVESVAGLERLQQLTTLDLSGSDLQNLLGIEKLTRLESLALNGCQIKSLRPIAGLKSLKSLDLRGTNISSLDGLPHSVTTLKLGDRAAESTY